MRRTKGRASGLIARRLGVVGAALAAGMASAHADARPMRICIMGTNPLGGLPWGVWCQWDTDNGTGSLTIGSYNQATRSGVIDFTVTGNQDPSDFLFTDIPGPDGMPVTITGPVDMAMGTFEVIDGIGTSECTFAVIDLWLHVGPLQCHIAIPTNIESPLFLTGFTADGSGIYHADGLSIPVEFVFEYPDGTVVPVSETCEVIEFISPLDLTPACPADMDGNGVLNLDDVNYFVQNFLAGCA